MNTFVTEQNGDRVFGRLKQAMRLRKVNYRQLAAHLNVSEQVIKRLFKDKDCKLSRLIDICRFLNITLDDLLTAEVKAHYSAVSVEAEQALSEDRQLFIFLVLLISHFTVDDIKKIYELDEPTVYQYLRDLEKLGLIKLGTGVDFQFIIELPIKLSLDGPAMPMVRQLNQHFLHRAMDYAGDPFVVSSTSRLMRKESIQKIQKELEEVHQKFQNLSRIDQLFYPPEQLNSYKWLSVTGPFDIPSVVNIPLKVRNK